ncbi:Hypothetical predicted protein [Olea europaea subsp. europaea]|uniref:Uncharacterized protein n=1 Tax=Olea europaea subsp. europaea TaxID=158383 RepID=A0A8S0RT80_OLEEU|nr:Hypothetical predicted protein [Olea europaea subsp. europaea]
MYEDSDGRPTAPNASLFVSEIGSGDNETGRPDKIQLWKNTHYKDTKGWIHPVVEEKHKEMVDIQTTQHAHIVGEESEIQGVQLTANDISTQVLRATSCYYTVWVGVQRFNVLHLV